jgi:hypothetical protein
MLENKFWIIFCLLGVVCGCTQPEPPPVNLDSKAYLLAIENAGKYIDCTNYRTTFRIHQDGEHGRELLVVSVGEIGEQLVSEIQADGSLRVIGEASETNSSKATKHLAKTLDFMLKENPSFPITNFQAKIDLRGSIADVFLVRLPAVPGGHTELKSSDEGVIIVGRGR